MNSHSHLAHEVSDSYVRTMVDFYEHGMQPSPLRSPSIDIDSITFHVRELSVMENHASRRNMDSLLSLEPSQDTITVQRVDENMVSQATSQRMTQVRIPISIIHSLPDD